MAAFEDPEIYCDILHALQIGVSVLDAEKKIVFWSDGAEQISGYTQMDVLGHLCSDNVLEHCNQNNCEMCDGCPITMALKHGHTVESMNFIHHKAGHRIQVHSWSIPLRDKHGSIIGAVQTFEGEFAVAGPEEEDRRTRERGSLDEVTGLPNRAMMQAHLREILGTFVELQNPFGVVCLVVSDLSQFQARYGQVAARSILQVLARTLRNTVWPTDFVGRWSDDQFMVILSGCREDALQTVSQRVLNMMASTAIHWWGEELRVTVSIGRTEGFPGDSVESIMQRVQRELKGDVQPSPKTITVAAGGGASSRKSS